MTTNQPLNELKDELHISHSQIFTYLTCSLKYRYVYVEQRPMERASIALAFGKSNKTAAKSYTQDFVDDDNQLTCYAYLLAANRLVAPTADVHGRMDVLLKTKTPKLKHYPTVRTAHHRRRFAKLAGAVLAGIDARIFIPCKTWLCSDCQYAGACEAW